MPTFVTNEGMPKKKSGVEPPSYNEEVVRKTYEEIEIKNDTESNNRLCFGKLIVTSKLVLLIGYCELIFLVITLVLTIAQYARFSPLTNRMSDILIVILVGIVIGFFIIVLLFIGLAKSKLIFLKIHYTGQAVASCYLLLSFVFIFTSVFGQFDERYFYGEQSPPIMITLGVLWFLATPFSIFFGIVVRQYYKQEEEKKRQIARMKKASSNHIKAEETANTIINETSVQKSNGLVNNVKKVENLNGLNLTSSESEVFNSTCPPLLTNGTTENKKVEQDVQPSDTDTVSSVGEAEECETYEDLCHTDDTGLVEGNDNEKDRKDSPSESLEQSDQQTQRQENISDMDATKGAPTNATVGIYSHGNVIYIQNN